ncbi:MAG: DoxX family protein [Candidatus Peregrinibacteria bacterium]
MREYPLRWCILPLRFHDLLFLSSKSASTLYLLFRVLVGLLFLQHGLQKLGLLEDQFAVNGFMRFVGLCEPGDGVALVFGVFTRLVALLGTILLIGAYITTHAGNGVLPIQNRGELALLYVAAFAVLFAQGAGRLSLERTFWKREFF